MYVQFTSCVDWDYAQSYRLNARIIIKVFAWIYSKLRVKINSMNVLRGRPENILSQHSGCWLLRFNPLPSPLNGPQKYKNFLMFQFKKGCLNLLDTSIQVAHSHRIREIAFLYWYSRAVGNNARVLPSLKIDFQSQGRGCVLTWIYKCWFNYVLVCHMLILCQTSALINSKFYSNLIPVKCHVYLSMVLCQFSACKFFFISVKFSAITWYLYI